MTRGTHVCVCEWCLKTSNENHTRFNNQPPQSMCVVIFQMCYNWKRKTRFIPHHYVKRHLPIWDNGLITSQVDALYRLSNKVAKRTHTQTFHFYNHAYIRSITKSQRRENHPLSDISWLKIRDFLSWFSYCFFFVCPHAHKHTHMGGVKGRWYERVGQIKRWIQGLSGLCVNAARRRDNTNTCELNKRVECIHRSTLNIAILYVPILFHPTHILCIISLDCVGVIKKSATDDDDWKEFK